MACGTCGDKSRQLNNQRQQMEVQGNMENKQILETALKVSQMLEDIPDISGADIRKVCVVVQGLYTPTATPIKSTAKA